MGSLIPQHACGVHKRTYRKWFSLLSSDPCNLTQLLRLAGKLFSPLSHVVSPNTVLKEHKRTWFVCVPRDMHRLWKHGEPPRICHTQ